MLEVKSIEELSALIESAPLLVVDFYTTWCMPCRIAADALAKIERDLEAKGFKLARADLDKIDVDKLAGKLKEPIRNVPTLSVFKDGREAARLVGVKLRHDFHLELKRFILSAAGIQ